MLREWTGDFDHEEYINDETVKVINEDGELMGYWVSKDVSTREQWNDLYPR